MDWDSTGSAHLDPCHKGLPLPLWRRIIRLAQQDPGDVLAPVAVACTLELRALRLVSKSGQNLVDLLLDYVKVISGGIHIFIIIACQSAAHVTWLAINPSVMFDPFKKYWPKDAAIDRAHGASFIIIISACNSCCFA